MILQHNEYKRCCDITVLGISVVRKQILGDWERKVLQGYLKGEHPKGYTALLFHIRKMGLQAIIDGCEADLKILRQLVAKEKN